MNASEPLKVLAEIAAMETFVENFPMSILDLMHGPTYTSVFIFLIDILREANVPIQEIANKVLEKVFGIKAGIQGGINTIYQSIMDMEIDEQSEFLQSLESGVKTIIMALLSSIFSCSAIPILPTRYFDTGRVWFNNSDSPDWYFNSYRDYIKGLIDNREILIPINTLNTFGYMDINPFTNAGKLYFSVDGGDKYYKKVLKKELVSDPTSQVTLPDCDVLSKVYLEFGEGHAEFLSNQSAIDEIVLRTNTPIDEDLIATISYTNQIGTEITGEIKIPAGRNVSEIYHLTSNDASSNKDIVHSIRFVGGNTGKVINSGGKKIYAYLSKNDSMEVINFWKANDNDSLYTMEWGNPEGCGVRTYTLEDAIENEIEVYEYTLCDYKVQEAERMNYVPSNPTESSPEHIVCYSGLDPNTIYRTDDMNAFLWYVANRGIDAPQVELNKMMWDNRRVARKHGTARMTDQEWNDWYNSKATEDNEFYFQWGDITPLMQLRKSGDAIAVKFPSQTYFKPNSGPLDSELAYKQYRMNSTIYKFNYDYLQSIRIFNPKVLLFDMFDSLLGGALSLLLSTRAGLTKTELEATLSSAIKKYVEADDAEIEDCFFTFSNEEYDKMLEDMLLSKYSATYTGGEVNRATQHDVEDYMVKIDSINLSSSAAGETTKITKLVTEVSASAGNEGTIEYGITAGVDDNWWKKLLWAIALPLIKCIFTPQVIMLFLINFQIMGITSLEDLWSNNQSAIIRLVINKIFSLIKSIFLFIRDKLAEILLDFFVETILPLLAKYQLLLIREKLEAWITLLAAAIACLPRLKFEKPVGTIDEVDYADIINEQKTPETAGGC